MRGTLSLRVLNVNKPSQKYPISARLAAIPKRIKTENTAGSRVSVVSEELCNDVLDFHKASLERHKGCTIIDILPGAGLWSSKVHELLQPKRHILVEPEMKFFAPFLRPLLDAPESRYTLEEPPLRDILNTSNFFDHWTHDTPPNPTAGPNNDILVLASLTRTPYKFNKGITRMTSPLEHFTHFYMNNLFRSSGLHANGPVRLLAWCLDQDRFMLNPRTVARLARTNIYAGNAARIEEWVVGETQIYHGQDRHAVAEVRSAIATAERMKDAGFVMPGGRSNLLHDRILKPDENYNPVEDLAALQEYERKWADSEFEARTTEVSDGGRDLRSKAATKEFERFTTLRKRMWAVLGRSVLEKYFSHSTGGKQRIDEHAFTSLDLLHLEQESAKAGDGASERERHKMEEEKKRLEEKLEANTKRLYKKDKTNAQLRVDNDLALETTPPALVWDRRRFEPMLAEEKEYWPQHELSLIDIDPTWGDSVEATAIAKDKCFILNKPIIHFLSTRKDISVAEALDEAAHGASEAIVPQCPSLTDPLRCGHRDVHNLRVRMLTIEHLQELQTAWDQWPFRVDVSKFRKGLHSKYQSD